MPSDTTLTPMLLTDAQVGHLLGVCRRTVWTLSATGDLPRPIRIGRAARWRYDQIVAYVERLAAEQEMIR